MNGWPILTTLTLTPLFGALVTWIIGRDNARTARASAVGFSLLAFLQAAVLVMRFNTVATGLQFVERHAWIPALHVDYFVAVDGLSILLVFLSALLIPFALALSPVAPNQPHGYYGLFLLLQTGLFGTFTALNFFHWFIYWELSLVPAYFLIKLWGGENRRAAATQFFVYTFVGSVTLLLAMQAVYLATDTFDLIQLADLARSGELGRNLQTKLHWTGLSSGALGGLLFAGVFLGFAVKIPVMPFHTWLPDTYATAPTSVTMILTGAMSKMGVYGLLRILIPIFPQPMRDSLSLLMPLAVLTIVASAFAAFAQKDLKRLLAYSSMNHLGYCLLGLFAALMPSLNSAAGAGERAAVLSGVLVQLFNHGITAATLFGFIALFEKRSGGRRAIGDFGGLRQVAPVLAGFMGIAIFASVGLPGLNGFVGEFLIFKGAFPLAPVPTTIATVGLLMTAVFYLTMIQRVFAGPLNPAWTRFPDLTRSEIALFVPATVVMFVLGLAPGLILNLVNPAVLEFVKRLAP